jgi:type II secretory pathway pseudopilin PulG
MRSGRRRGSSFVEVLAALSIVGIAMLVMLQQLTISYRENDLGQDQMFAYQKALSMVAELQASVDRRVIRDGLELDAMADVTDNPVLTTLTNGGAPLAPDHPMSANRRQGNAWQWTRRLSVEPVVASDRMRYARVQMKRLGRDGRAVVVATVGGVLNLPVTSSPSAKAYDVFVLAIGAAPSLWQPMGGLRSLIQTASEEIEARNAGLELRLHWITKLGYGRDQLYTPFVNEVDTSDIAAPWVYWYPGKLGLGTSASTLFASELIGGRVLTETRIVNDYHATENPYPHAVADQFNHAMRLAPARALFAQRVAAGLDDPHEPPLQLLLEDMHATPERFQNAIFVNLHGSALPFPPLRNYSDAAREPVAYPEVRVVTHPARLRAARDPNGDGNHADTEDLELRVYAYKTLPSQGANVLVAPITVQIMGRDLTGDVNGAAPSLSIRRLQGGVDPRNGNLGGPNEYYAFDHAKGLPPVRGTEPEPYEMNYEIGYVASPEPYTWIRLYNTPLGTQPLSGNTGLATTQRLYGFDYIPSPVGAGGGFPIDLATGVTGPKNTARWRIRIPKSAFEPGFPGGTWPNVDTVIHVKTRIGTDLTSGVAWPIANAPGNLSQTWSWWASSPSAVPLTERYQLLGDPRHCPYADLGTGGTSFPDGYNWFFDDLVDGATNVRPSWPCLDGTRLAGGFGPGVVVDVPRVMQVWRDALQSTAGLWTNAGGALAGSVLLGGEIALPPAPNALEPMAVPVFGSFYGHLGLALVDSVTQDYAPGVWPAPLGSVVGTDDIGMATVVQLGTSGFWVKEWLGELAPDASHAQFSANGNVVAGVVAGSFCRQVRSRAVLAGLPAGTSFAVPSGAFLGEMGGASLLQFGTASATFQHVPQSPGATVSLTADGREILTAAGIGMPTDSSGLVPFSLAGSLAASLPQDAFPGIYPDHFVQLLEALADGPAPLSGGAVLRLLSPSGTRRAFFTVLGDTPASVSEHTLLGRKLLLFALRGFHVAGEPSFNNDVDQVPRVVLTSPAGDDTLVNPASVLLRWRTLFRRFDGERYTTGYPTGFNGDETQLAYVVMYSSDGGDSWRHAIDDSPAQPGIQPENVTLLQLDAGVGDESYLMLLPSVDFPAGTYMIRVDCHHRVRDLHSSSHQIVVQITR